MSNGFLTWMADEFRAAGLDVHEFSGWRTRSRSTGGFDGPGRTPLGVGWHHTAGSQNEQAGNDWQVNQSSARPISNVTIYANGRVWILAAGATNTHGRGRSIQLSRGTVPTDSGNRFLFGIEIANRGTGELYTRAQLDAVFTVSNIINRRCGNRLDDIVTHTEYAPGRKIDPATAAAASAQFPVRSINSSGSWNVNDLRTECVRRGSAGSTPPPTQPTPPPTPPPAPPPADSGAVAVSPVRYWVRRGDSQWSVGERVYGSGQRGVQLLPASAFNRHSHHIDIPTINGHRTTVRSGEGAHAILRRLGRPTSTVWVDTFHIYNGGASRMLHPGDVVFVPDRTR